MTSRRLGIRSRKHGKPSAPARRRLTPQQRRAQMPPRLRVLADMGTALLAAGAALYIARGPGGLEWALCAAIAAVAATAALTWRIAPRFVHTAAVLALWLLLVPIITWLYAAVTPELGLGYDGRLAGMGLYALLIAVLAHRTTHGVPAITVALTLAVVTAVAALTYAVDIQGGVWLSYLAGLLVVALRGKAGDWVGDTVDQAVEWRATRKSQEVAHARWASIAAPEALTASALIGLPEGYTVIHDRIISGSVDDAATIDHIVTGPAGVTVVASMHLSDPVTVHTDGSLRSGRRNLDGALRECAWQAQVILTRTDLPAQTVLVVHGAPVDPVTLGMWEHVGADNETLIGAVTVLPGDQPEYLINTITAPADDDDQPSGTAAATPWGKATTRRYARRIARAFPAGRLVRPSTRQDRAQAAMLYPSAQVRTAPLGADPDPAKVDQAHQNSARVLDPVEQAPAGPLPEHREYEWDGGDELDDVARGQLAVIASCTLRPGAVVNALRPDGMLIGWVVMSEPYLHADGAAAVVDIVEHSDWETCQKRGTPPAFYLAEPLAHLMSVDAP